MSPKAGTSSPTWIEPTLLRILTATLLARIATIELFFPVWIAERACFLQYSYIVIIRLHPAERLRRQRDNRNVGGEIEKVDPRSPDPSLSRRSIGDVDFDAYAPGGARSYGLQFGRTFGADYAGVFLGRNRFQTQGTASDNSYISGNLRGLEGRYDLGGTTLFAQYGKACMISETDVAISTVWAPRSRWTS